MPPKPALVLAARNLFSSAPDRTKLSQQLLAQVVFPVANGVLVRDAQLNLLHVNETMLRGFNFKREVPLGRQLQEYCRTDLLQVFLGLDEEVLRSRQPCVAVLPEGASTTHPKAEFRVTSTPIYDTEGELEGIVTLAADQSELRLAERNAYSAEQRFRSLWDAMPLPAGVFRVSFDNGGIADLRMTDCNPALIELVGSRELPFDRSATELWPTFRDVELLEQIAKLMAGAPSFSREVFSGLFGRQFNMSFRRWGDDSLLLFLQDVTELRQAEQHLLRLNHTLLGAQAEQQRRSEALLEDANQFMSAVVDRLDEVTAAVGELSEQQPTELAAQIAQVGQKLQVISEKTLRYTGVSMLPQETKLLELQGVMQGLFTELSAQFPHITFKAVDLPSLILSRDAVVSVVRNLVDHVQHEDPSKSPREVVISSAPSFVETGIAIEFRGFKLDRYVEALADEKEIEADWEHFTSLQLAAVRRILTFHDRALSLTRGNDNAVRFLIHTRRKAKR